MEKHEEHSTHKNKSNINVLLASFVLGGFILASAFVVSNGGSSGEDFVDPDKYFMGRELKDEEFTQGSSKSKVVFLQYSDTECPFCKKFHEEVVSKIEVDEKYKNIGIAYRHFPLPFHTKAPKEAEATMCAREQGGQDAYKKYIDEIFKRTPTNDGLDASELPKMAETLGLDVAKFNECLSSNKYAEQVQADLEDGAMVEVAGTPHTLVMIKTDDGYRLITRINGARDYNYTTKILDRVMSLIK